MAGDSGNKGKGLVGIVGVVAAGILMTLIPSEEGTRYKAYRDVAGVWTICQGDTNNVHPGMVEDKEGCKTRLVSQLETRAPLILACTPTLADKPYTLAAAVSLSYNIGTTGYCSSTVAKRFNEGDVKGGCNAFLLWDKARVHGKLRVVKGLSARRQRERSICLQNI